jgi:ribonucleoside-diphosphate reductase alpha chain
MRDTMESNTNQGGLWYNSVVGQGIIKAKYLHDNEDIEGMFNRVTKYSGVLAMRQYLENADIIPAGRALYALGSKGKFNASSSNCYILGDIKDNIESIYDTLKEAARISSFGGGVGFDISKLRPKGSTVNNSAKSSSGAVSFLGLFNASGAVIGSNGRRNAMMAMIDCSHPDIYEFLRIKQSDNKLESMNISIKFTDEFMVAVRDDTEYKLRFTIEDTGEYIEKTIKAKEFFVELCKSSWDYGDPGVAFIDTVRDHQMLKGYDEYEINCSNP